MTRICPKCNYARQPTDNCPEWQCPSCQVAYNKVGATAQAYGRYGAPATQVEATSAGALKWIVLAAVVGVAIWLGKPLWQASKTSVGVTVQATANGQPAVTLYSTEWCGYCTATRQFFIANGIQYVELDIEKTTEGYEGHKKLGGRGVPLITVGDDVIRGYNERALRTTLRAWLKEP